MTETQFDIIKMMLVIIHTIMEMYIYYAPHSKPPPSFCMGMMGKNKVSQIDVRSNGEANHEKEGEHNKRLCCKDDYSQEWKDFTRYGQKIMFWVCISINICIALTLIVRSFA